MSSSPTTSSAGMFRMSVSIQPLDTPDIPACARLSAAAFTSDPHTIVKQLGRQPYDMFTIARSDLEENHKRQNFVCVKGVDDQGGIVGHASWVFSGGGQRRAPSRGTDTGSGNGEPPAVAAAEEADPIERLHALEEADTQYWLQNLVPLDTPCMFVVGLAVSPSHEGKGIGTALLRHGNAIADAHRLSIWAHSSHQAYAAYSKAGFETRRELRIDLDNYAPRPPHDGEATMTGSSQDDAGRWGQYVIRYMERMPGGK
ncbi:hypothetical protein F4808DRAFT_307004 [Astrocystis sublimbata]|nr:hypothetical protein F4808DRAFT_63440 [Astrocystis sublimbata]KAI0204694.1 hypothetical protein F4808DRAFT_307004 [Astrocystis sublimbata]